MERDLLRLCVGALGWSGDKLDAGLTLVLLPAANGELEAIGRRGKGLSDGSDGGASSRAVIRLRYPALPRGLGFSVVALDTRETASHDDKAGRRDEHWLQRQTSYDTDSTLHIVTFDHSSLVRLMNSLPQNGNSEWRELCGMLLAVKFATRLLNSYRHRPLNPTYLQCPGVRRAGSSPPSRRLSGQNEHPNYYCIAQRPGSKGLRQNSPPLASWISSRLTDYISLRERINSKNSKFRTRVDGAWDLGHAGTQNTRRTEEVGREDPPLIAESGRINSEVASSPLLYTIVLHSTFLAPFRARESP
ncbi:hypothetical protein B0H11DRAFT_1915984 [Mycena galericulata]|nr:hypothetical protein B0H11DRAFT_1915984 [Mycena galericulata]